MAPTSVALHRPRCSPCCCLKSDRRDLLLTSRPSALASILRRPCRRELTRRSRLEYCGSLLMSNHFILHRQRDCPRSPRLRRFCRGWRSANSAGRSSLCPVEPPVQDIATATDPRSQVVVVEAAIPRSRSTRSPTASTTVGDHPRGSDGILVQFVTVKSLTLLLRSHRSKAPLIGCSACARRSRRVDSGSLTLGERPSPTWGESLCYTHSSALISRTPE